MKLSRVTVENLGPYFGRHTIDLTVTREAPVILIHGENERGKTSFANAIRWCLYKTAKGRGGSLIPAHRLINNHAKESGIFNMAVRLEFDHDGNQYILERHVQSDRRPTDDGDLDSRVEMRKNGNFEPVKNIDGLIREILPSQISRFYLFDGEMLNEYEDLLRKPDRNTQIVRQSIEQILGLPSLQRAVQVLEEIKRAAEQKQRQEARIGKENQRLIAEAQQKDEALNAVERDIANHMSLRDRIKQERDTRRQQLEQYAEVLADLKQLDRCEEEVAAIDIECEEKREEIRSLLKDCWWLSLEQKLEHRARESERKAQDAARLMAEFARLRDEIQRCQTSLRDSRCSLCGHIPAASEIAEIERRLRKSTDDLSALEAAQLNPGEHFEHLTLVRPFVGKAVAKILYEKERVLRQKAIRRRQVEGEMVEIRDRVRADPRVAISQIERGLEEQLTQLQAVERLLGEAQASKRELGAASQRLNAQIRKLPDSNRQLAGEAAVLEVLKDLFDAGVTEFRDRLRTEVERAASEIHRALTTEPSYGGLRINEQYGLQLLSELGKVIPDRSAGSEQIVALSLIGALNRCATREGPIVMDTPFGRLDLGHRHNILRFIPQFGAQVVLLVQSGEFERERDNTILEGKTAREYTIVRDGASDRSRFTLAS